MTNDHYSSQQDAAKNDDLTPKLTGVRYLLEPHVAEECRRVMASFNRRLKDANKPIAYWDDVAREHFAPNAQMKLTLWKCDGSPRQTPEAKPYVIKFPHLSRFFATFAEEDARSMEFCTNDTTLHPRQLDETGSPLIAYSKAMWIFTYGGGERVFAEGPLSIFFKPYGDGHFIIRNIAFDAIEHSSTRTGRGAQVESRVNFFGMPPSTLRCLDNCYDTEGMRQMNQTRNVPTAGMNNTAAGGI
ncbi:hypothetical protein POSPLADRAFT_1047915 [Postia placenta MAD-698-R-SB12]|uniref:Uncharacterized protein n=1 Tax=Postia placenta MAD-698-R-SB12 TaxID=670580 RepID=A0A1X6MW63_9APHY|nr:hypothetical protein POSPLADRAFT_1047915 [Postia placenta MAD-698-R-SB12]OSX60480.1 hypothetical protein POSPLADRAFT_1047915 [Postia placenta MAD-698-R-SB12]